MLLSKSDSASPPYPNELEESESDPFPTERSSGISLTSEGDTKEVTDPIIPLPRQSGPKMSAHEPSL
ncbi:hypothetical protein L208DRAFT_1404429, partial [Tricholoma matsutake]